MAGSPEYQGKSRERWNDARPLLRLVVCGSVDDGKSTLIGRMLYESRGVYDDQWQDLVAESERAGGAGGGVDLAMLVDGLQAEKEQGITIDVAYRNVEFAGRRYVLADVPGHEQYTRNMVTGASNADAAVILVDAVRGLTTQTRRHSRIVAMMGVRDVVLAVNKMDLVGFSREVFDAIADAFGALAATLGFGSVRAVPISARDGDNVFGASARVPWYAGPALMAALDAIEPAGRASEDGFRLPIQWVNRLASGFRGYCGRIERGSVRVGDRLRLLPAGTQVGVKTILRGFDSVDSAAAGESVTLALDTDVDASRGDVLAAGEPLPEVSDQFEARVVWMSERPLLPGRQYLMKCATSETVATISGIKHVDDPASGAALAATQFGLNDIGRVTLALSAPIAFEPYARSRALGGFVLVDKFGFDTAGAGMIEFGLRRAANVRWQSFAVNKRARALQKDQRPMCVWFTGLSGAGKSTIAGRLETRLHMMGRHTYLLDGDNVRLGLNRDLGFKDADRVENVRRVAEVARLMVDAGLIVLVSLISPFRGEREMARGLFEAGEFLEVFVDAPLEVCERRDPKGLYAKARRGELKNFTGIDSPYEVPVRADIRVDARAGSIDECVEMILALVE